jgi:hypothetical protein
MQRLSLPQALIQRINPRTCYIAKLVVKERITIGVSVGTMCDVASELAWWR